MRKTGDALDHVSLKMLARRPKVRERATSPAGVRLLWSVCQIPDFRKTLTEAHLQLLDTVFGHLARSGCLPVDWVADQVGRLEQVDGDIDTLIGRLAHIRTWTYVAHRAEWLADAGHWQERTRAVEDRLSDALHERLTQRFVDRRTQAFLKSLREDAPLGSVAADGAILVEGQALGRIEGLQPVLPPAGSDLEKRAMNRAARRLLLPELERRARALLAAPAADLALGPQGQILWRFEAAAPARIADLVPGATVLAPRPVLWAGEQLASGFGSALTRHLQDWLAAQLAVLAAPLQRLAALPLEGPGRGLVFLLTERLGSVPMASARSLLKDLSAADRARLSGAGLRFGVRHLYLPALLKGRAIELRALLWRLQHRAGALPPPPAGRVSLPLDDGLPADYASAIGYEPLGAVALRIDIVERVAAQLRAATRIAPSAPEPALANLAGLSQDGLLTVARALGFGVDGAGLVSRLPTTPSRPRRKAERQAASSPFAALRQMRLGAS